MENPNLFIFKTRSDIAKLLIDPDTFQLFVRAISNVTDEYGEASHTR